MYFVCQVEEILILFQNEQFISLEKDATADIKHISTVLGCEDTNTALSKKHFFSLCFGMYALCPCLQIIMV